MDQHRDEPDERIGDMAAAMAKVGVGLLALPLAELPPIASIRIRYDLRDELCFDLQLAAFSDTAAALCAWAAVLPERTVTGRKFDDYIRIEVVGEIDGVKVAVWDHISGEPMAAAGRFLGLPLDGEPHLLTLAALRGLAEHQAVTTDA